LALIKRMKKNDSKFNAKALERKGADTCPRETHGGRYMLNLNNKGENNMLDKIMKGADASINVGIKLISLAIVLQIVFGHSVPFLGGNVIGTIIGIIAQLGSAGLVGLIAALIIYRLLDDDIRKELSK